MADVILRYLVMVTCPTCNKYIGGMRNVRAAMQLATDHTQEWQHEGFEQRIYLEVVHDIVIPGIRHTRSLHTFEIIWWEDGDLNMISYPFAGQTPRRKGVWEI